jgi:3-hydroxyisobutyrate dehydrogenase-like beta-hydroxyacid dehydrogenase
MDNSPVPGARRATSDGAQPRKARLGLSAVGWIGEELGSTLAAGMHEAGVVTRAWSRAQRLPAPFQPGSARASASKDDEAGTDVVFSLLDSDRALGDAGMHAGRNEDEPEVRVDWSTVAGAFSQRAAGAAATRSETVTRCGGNAAHEIVSGLLTHAVAEALRVAQRSGAHALRTDTLAGLDYSPTFAAVGLRRSRG